MSPVSDERFLTRPLSVVLDFVRFGAALLVAVGHAVQLGLYHGWFPFGVRMQHYCVIVFFVLSGLVISTSVLGGRSNLPRYAVARISRILPVAIPSLIFSTLAAYLLAGPSPVRMDNSPEDALAVTRQLLAPLTFISAWPGVAGPVWNPPYWSLCYEVWYYAIFALAAFLRGWLRVIAVIVGCAAAGGAILLLMPVWLFGVALTHTPAARRLPLAAAPFLLAAAVWMALALFEIDRETLNPLLKAWWPGDAEWSQWALSDLFMGVVMTTALAGVRPLANRLAKPVMRLETAAKTLAGFSFTLYLFHWPLIQLLRSWGIEAGRSFPVFAALVGLIVLSCAAISLLTERQSPKLRRWMEERFPRASAPVVTIPA
ncbi:peptidoglycan/LPS O-acetylase OafA/YrhL [Novosphingobium sp. ST904]|nr:peptidoglycan/LPS O-acetylase OafA/YrhL [Novosphingobium sp. ST904]